MTADQIASAVHLLKPQPGQVLVFQHPDGAPIEPLMRLAESLALPIDCNVMLLPDSWRAAYVDPSMTVAELERELSQTQGESRCP
jgi:uncharacterized protein (DUF302 family)